MLKFLLILALGIALGYGYGWRDAQVNERNFAERVVERIGGDNKGMNSANTDAVANSVVGK